VRRRLIPFFVVRSFLCCVEPPRRVGWWLSLYTGSFQLTFIDRSPQLPANDVTKWGRSYAQGGQKRQSCLPLLFSLAEGTRSRGDNPPPFCRPTGDNPGLFSLSPSPRLLVEVMSHLPPDRILRWVGIPWFTMTTPKTLHKVVSTMKR
jgi:hypothetical protein